MTTQPQTVRAADVLVVAVKTYDTEPALESLSHLKVGDVLSIQNGVLKNEQLARTFGWDKTLGVAVVLSGEVTPAGPVCFTLNEYFLPADCRDQPVAAVTRKRRRLLPISPNTCHLTKERKVFYSDSLVRETA